MLAQSAGGGCRLAAAQPRQPVADLLLRFPPVPGGIPGQHDANGFLEQSEVACLAARTAIRWSQVIIPAASAVLLENTVR